MGRRSFLALRLSFTARRFSASGSSCFMPSVSGRKKQHHPRQQKNVSPLNEVCCDSTEIGRHKMPFLPFVSLLLRLERRNLHYLVITVILVSGKHHFHLFLGSRRPQKPRPLLRPSQGKKNPLVENLNIKTVTDCFVLWWVPPPPPPLTPLGRCERDDGADRLDGARRRVCAFGHGLLGFLQVRQSHALPAQRQRLSPAQKQPQLGTSISPLQEFWF